MNGLAISFPSVLDELIEFINTSGIVQCGNEKPGGPSDFIPPDEYCLVWLGGGRQNTKVTAEVILNFEVWVRKVDSLSQVTAERLAEDVRAAVSTRSYDRQDGITKYSVTWPGFPASMEPTDAIDQANWARVVFMGQITVRGKKFVA